MSWFDTHAATAAADSWFAGGDRLEVESRTIALVVDALQLHGAPAGVRSLDIAADELHTLARFVIAVRDRARRADRLPDDATSIDELWWDMAALVARTNERRDAVAADQATARFLDSLDDERVREHFEGPDGADPIEVLSQLSGHDATRYWRALPESTRLDIAERRPDVVALRVLAADGVVSKAVVEALDRANAFDRFEESFAVELGVSVSARVVAIELGAGLSAIVTKRSDDHVELTLLGRGSAGAGLDLDIPHTASGSGAAEAVFELHQRFDFPDDGAAARAIDTLREAARQDASFGEIIRDGVGVLWNRGAADWNASAAFLNWVVPFGDPVPELPVRDLTPETVQRLRTLWDTNGVSRTQASGAEITVSAEFEQATDAIGAALSGDVEARLMRYDVEVADADTTGASARTGVAFSGTVELDGALPVRGLPGDLVIGERSAAHGAASAGFVADLHHTADGGTLFTLTLHTDLAGGAATSLIDLGIAGLDETTDDVAAVTLEMTVPVDAATVGAVGRLGSALARRRWPADAIGRLAERAEVGVTISTGTATERSADVGVGIVDIDAGIERANRTTVAALHRYPGGEMFSRIDVDRLIDAARISRADRP